jgi:tRNA (guanine37-N1)-methyltransferase
MINEFLKDNEVLCDMFCGVGPLSVKAAVKRPKIKVLANDLNPEGVEYLKKNISLNKVDKRVLPFNMDARQFLRMLVNKDD